MPKFAPKTAALLALALLGSAPMIGCEKSTDTAGGVGQKIDKTLDPRGPAEKVGDKIDGAAK